LLAASFILAISLSALTSAANVANEVSVVDLNLPKEATAGPGASTPHLRASLLIDSNGEESRVGVLFDLDPGWHLYWRNPGDTGLAPELDWQLGLGGIGKAHWPTPHRFDGLGTGLSSFGYSDQVLLGRDLPDYDSVGVLEVHVNVLICENECIPVEFSLSRPRPDSGNKAQLARERAIFDHYAKQLPRTPASMNVVLEARYSHSALRPGDEFEGAIAIESCRNGEVGCVTVVAADEHAFIPDLETDEALAFEFMQPIAHPDRPSVSLLRFHASVESDVERPLTRLAGVLSVRSRDGERQALEIELPFPGAAADSESAFLGSNWLTSPREKAPSFTTATTAAPTTTTTASNESPAFALLRVILLALLGGLILNGMPCVLPVLGIKICSAAELAQQNPRELRRHGFAYLAGVLASMAALASVVLFLQAAGASVGWGFQFQEPLFVAIVTAVVVLFALNLFGVFEIQISTSQLSRVGGDAQGPMRSFFDGLLAVVLATPCTAPFLGTAVGFAFAGGPAMIIAIFLAIGAGLAAPYTLVCLVPGWSRFVPRAGGWMLRLRAGLGFLLLATAVWLIWIFGRSAGADGQSMLLASLVALSFGVWLLGWIQKQASPAITRTFIVALALLFAFGLSRIDVASRAAEPTTRSTDYLNFNPAAIEAALAADRPVFVSFTADWCITCKVNERAVLADSRVREALEQRGFSSFRGDWTRRDETIRKELARHGRAGVPLYLVYDPRNPGNPTVLPELLSVSLVLAALERAGSTGNEATQTAQWQPLNADQGL
jgi:thiol:disulfide interchange protein DsbD